MSVLALLVGLSVAVALLVASFSVPWRRWTFQHAGRQIEVLNYPFKEQILVDGELVADTRNNGDGFTWAEHKLDVDGAPLRVWIGLGTGGMSVICRADNGRRVIFQSDGEPPLLDAPPEQPEKVEPRLAAARVLLADVAKIDRSAARELENALVQVLAAEASARASVDAHATLGGNADEASALLARRGEAVDEVLRTLRALHLRIAESEDPGAAVDQAREALDRLGAAHEVARLARGRAARRERE